jgi:hypothetical protein
MGAGPIGLVTLLAAHAFGSPKVVIADISPERLKVAEELGANASVVLSTNDSVRASGDSSRDSFTLYSLLFSNLYKHIVRQFPDWKIKLIELSTGIINNFKKKLGKLLSGCGVRGASFAESYGRGYRRYGRLRGDD